MLKPDLDSTSPLGRSPPGPRPSLQGPLMPAMHKEADAYLRQGGHWKPAKRSVDVLQAQAVAVLGAGGFGQVGVGGCGGLLRGGVLGGGGCVRTCV